MIEEKLLKGKVADILGVYDLAINLGRNSGVKLGMEFDILGQTTITDPDTHKKLGAYSYEKVRVKVNKIEDEYCVASTITTTWAVFPTVFDVVQKSQPKLRSKEFAFEDLDRNVEVGDIVVERRHNE